jgi:hypothetical protein
MKPVSPVLPLQLPPVSMSLCGQAATFNMATNQLTVPDEIFQEHLVDFGSYCENPSALFNNPQLIFKIGELYYYCSLLLCLP